MPFQSSGYDIQKTITTMRTVNSYDRQWLGNAIDASGHRPRRRPFGEVWSVFVGPAAEINVHVINTDETAHDVNVTLQTGEGKRIKSTNRSIEPGETAEFDVNFRASTVVVRGSVDGHVIDHIVVVPDRGDEGVEIVISSAWDTSMQRMDS